MKRHRLHTSLLQVLGPASQIPSPMKVSNMANGRFIICLDLPRTVSIYAKKDNHSCSQPAHIFWTHLALPLLLPALQPHWPASNSSKHCISPNLGSFALFLHWRIFPSPAVFWITKFGKWYLVILVISLSEVYWIFLKNKHTSIKVSINLI